ncbi:MAG: serine protease [Dermatophilaceae bacterium]
MSDPLSLSVIGAAVAVEGVKFLYRQADALLEAWKVRRRRGAEVGAGEVLDVPVEPTAALSAAPNEDGADAARVKAAAEQLEELATALFPYAVDGRPLRLDDSELAQKAGLLRELLEAVYGQPLTFKGEQRERTGADVEVEQILTRLRDSTVTGIGEAAVGDGSSVNVRQKVDEAEGTVITGIGSVTVGSNAPPMPPDDPAIARDAEERWLRDKDEIERVRKAAAEGDLSPVNSKEQLSERRKRLEEKGLDLEGIVGDDDSLWAHFLAAGLRATSAVALIARVRPNTVMRPLGTGVLISENLVMTNHHVLPDVETAKGASAVFDYGHDENGNPRREVVVPLDVDAGFFADEALDFAVVAIRPDESLKTRRPMRLIAEPGKILMGERVNVIHHAGGERARVSIRANRLVAEDEDWLRYTSDTRRGSSGSPVFNDQWELVALHHAGISDPDKPQDRDAASANEGARVSRIVAALRTAQVDGPLSALLDVALSTTEED